MPLCNDDFFHSDAVFDSAPKQSYFQLAPARGEWINLNEVAHSLAQGPQASRLIVPITAVAEPGFSNGRVAYNSLTNVKWSKDEGVEGMIMPFALYHGMPKSSRPSVGITFPDFYGIIPCDWMIAPDVVVAFDDPGWLVALEAKCRQRISAPTSSGLRRRRSWKGSCPIA